MSPVCAIGIHWVLAVTWYMCSFKQKNQTLSDNIDNLCDNKNNGTDNSNLMQTMIV